MSLQRFICGESEDAMLHTPDCFREQGRVRGLLIFDESYDLADMAGKLNSGSDEDAEDVYEIVSTGIENGSIQLIPETRGAYDGGQPLTADGYKEGEIRTLAYNHTLEVKDPSYSTNRAFWEMAERRRWKVVWRTETLLHLVDHSVNIHATDPHEDSLESTVTWNVIATWRSKQKPYICPISSLAEFFNAPAQPRPVGPTLQSKTVVLGSSAPQTTRPDTGYDGLLQVSYDTESINPANIKLGESILGVSGTLREVSFSIVDSETLEVSGVSIYDSETIEL